MARGRKTGGRRRGTPNRTTAAVKEAVLGAFDQAGGETYLVQVAISDPRTFCTLLGKLLPTELKAEHSGAGDGPVKVDLVSVVGSLTREQRDQIREWLKAAGHGR